MGGSGGVRIGQFSTKKNNCLKHLRWPKKHFRQTYFFPFLGGGGLFTNTEFFSFDTLSWDHLATTRRPVSYRLRFTTCRSFLPNTIFFPIRGGVRPLVEFSNNFISDGKSLLYLGRSVCLSVGLQNKIFVDETLGSVCI